MNEANETAQNQTTELALEEQIRTAARESGLEVKDAGTGVDFAGQPTFRAVLAAASGGGAELPFEVSHAFQPQGAELAMYFAEAARRLSNPRPDCYLTLSGIPLSFAGFAWPFHSSTSGADTSILHGEVWLADGEASPLHARISASLTVTFREIVARPEQPLAESFIYNAVRKTMDQGQLELVKSGNRQPVPVTTRFYSSRQRRFVFNDTLETQRQEFLAAKVFWLSGVLGESRPVWVADPRDAQYLNTTEAELKRDAEALAQEGVIQLAPDLEFASPTGALMSHQARYRAALEEALAFLKPSFNEQMRGGHTNM